MSGIVIMRRILRAMSIIGLWDTYNFKNIVKRAVFYMYRRFILFFFFYSNISQCLALYQVKNDLIFMARSGGISLLFCLVQYKAFRITYMAQEITHLLAQLRYEENRLFTKRGDEENKIYNHAINHGWLITKICWFACISTTVIFYTINPLAYLVMGPQKIYNYKIKHIFTNFWFPFDPYSDDYYHLAYLLEFLAGIIGSFYQGVLLSFIVTLMIFGASQLKIIQCEIENLHKREDSLELSDSYLEFVDIVQHHCRTIIFLADLNELTNPIMFATFLICPLLICAVGLEVVVVGFTGGLIKPLYFLLSTLTTTFLCYGYGNEITLELFPKRPNIVTEIRQNGEPSTEIIQQSPKVGVKYKRKKNYKQQFESNNTDDKSNGWQLGLKIVNAAADSKWYLQSKRIKNGLYTMMLRAGKPLELYIGGFYPLSLSTFLTILNGAYSYLALLRQMYLSQKLRSA